MYCWEKLRGRGHVSGERVSEGRVSGAGLAGWPMGAFGLLGVHAQAPSDVRKSQPVTVCTEKTIFFTTALQFEARRARQGDLGGASQGDLGGSGQGDLGGRAQAPADA